MQTVDFHAHLLNPEVKFNRLYDKVVLALFAKKLGSSKEELMNGKYEAFVKTMMKNVSESKNISKTVLLPVDGVVNSKGKEISFDPTVSSNNEDVLKVHQEFPNLTIPFFSINPNREDALDLIDKYATLGFKGAKFLQNYWDIDINDNKYQAYFEKIKSYDLPIIIHTGSEYAVKSNPAYERVEIAQQAIDVGCKVVLAHCGVDVVMNKKFSNFLNNFSFDNKKFGQEYETMLRFLEDNENVYADTSALIALFRAKIVKDLALNQKHIHHKLIFGTDYPVPFNIPFSYCEMSWKRRFEIEKIKNPLDRYITFFNEYFEDNSIIYTNWQKLIKE